MTSPCGSPFLILSSNFYSKMIKIKRFAANNNIDFLNTARLLTIIHGISQDLFITLNVLPLQKLAIHRIGYQMYVHWKKFNIANNMYTITTLVTNLNFGRVLENILICFSFIGVNVWNSINDNLDTKVPYQLLKKI